MEKIININYQNRNISIEENAYEIFKKYEEELKNYFLKEESGEEIFADLQNRMAEIFEEKLKKGKVAIQQIDIDELKSTIGNPTDFENENAETKKEEPSFSSNFSFNNEKKLYRNKDRSNRILAGVCSGIANYTSIDPIAIRLIFVLFSFNIGVIVYLVLWVVLPVQEMKVNMTQKLFRNPTDKILGGICSGIAQFFKTETWIIRALFLAPVLLTIIGKNGFHLHLNFFGQSFASLMVITYGILWLITPLAKSSTDFMLLKGEPINISSIQNSTAKSSLSINANGGLNVFLKVIAYILIGLFLLFLIPSSIGILFGSLVSYKVASVILFTSFYKTLALIAILGMFALPLISAIIWIVRKIAGYKSPNRILRSVIGFLSAISFICALSLAYYLFTEMNTYAGIKNNFPISIASDTVIIMSLNENSVSHKNIFFQLNDIGNIIEEKESRNDIKAIRVKYKESADTSFYAEIEQTAFGRNSEKADANANIFKYIPVVENNIIKIPTAISLSNKIPYRLQNVKVTFYVPKGKTLIVDKELKKALSHSFKASNNSFNFHFDDDNNRNDEVINFGTDAQINNTITITDDDGTIIKQTTTSENETDFDNKNEAIKIAQENLKVAQRESERTLREAQKELENSQRESQRALQEAQRESQRTLREAQKELEKASR